MPARRDGRVGGTTTGGVGVDGGTAAAAAAARGATARASESDDSATDGSSASVSAEKRSRLVDAADGAEAWEVREKRRRKSERGKPPRKSKAGEDVDGNAREEPYVTTPELEDSARASPSVVDVGVLTEEGEKSREILGARVVVGAALAQGQRQYMEDRYSTVLDLKPEGVVECDGIRRSFLGVFDGHNGDWAAQFASERLHTFLNQDILTRNASPSCPDAIAQYNAEMEKSLKKMYMDCDAVILDSTSQQGRRDGSTALSILQVGNALFTAHAGDSRAVVGYADGRTRAMTEDHKPSTVTERRRVTEIGGRIEFCGCWRVIADHPFKPVRAALAVSRSLGDIDFKRPKDTGVTAEPDVQRYELNKNVNFVILATDGMWDVIRDQEAGDIARGKLTEHGVLLDGECTTSDLTAIESACNEASKELLETSLRRGTNDNVTVVVAMYVH